MLTVALIGRTNVGKSSLFNRIIGEAKAITAELPHTTRDRLTGTTVWRGTELRAIDTGGVEDLHPAPQHRRTRTRPATIETEIRAQAERAVAEADVLVLVIDARDGVLPGERTIARSLRGLGKPIIIACNKAETARLRLACAECTILGFGEAIPTSAVTGSGVGDLLDRMVEYSVEGERPPNIDAMRSAGPRSGASVDGLRERAPQGSASPPGEAGSGSAGKGPLAREAAESTPQRREASAAGARSQGEGTARDVRGPLKIAIVGEPNVGKSSLVNAILGREEVIVTPEPFTTRDVHDVEVEYDDQTVVLLDTAGIRRLAVRAVRTHRTRLEAIERLAVSRSLRAIERADVVCLVLDATRSASHHVKQLARAIVNAGRACIIVINKADLVAPPPDASNERVTRRGGPPPRADRDRARWGSDAAGPASEPSLAIGVRRSLPHLSWAPILPTSAIAGTGVSNILPTALAAAAAWRRTLTPAELAAVHAATKLRIPTARTRDGRRRSDLLELQEIGSAPPRFLLRTRKRVKLPQAIPAIVERTLRETFDFNGTPVRITVARST